jgi:hypothetical protein
MSVNSQQLAVNYEILFMSINQYFKLKKVTMVTHLHTLIICVTFFSKLDTFSTFSIVTFSINSVLLPFGSADRWFSVV